MKIQRSDGSRKGERSCHGASQPLSFLHLSRPRRLSPKPPSPTFPTALRCIHTIHRRQPRGSWVESKRHTRRVAAPGKAHEAVLPPPHLSFHSPPPAFSHIGSLLLLPPPFPKHTHTHRDNRELLLASYCSPSSFQQPWVHFHKESGSSEVRVNFSKNLIYMCVCICIHV